MSFDYIFGNSLGNSVRGFHRNLNGDDIGGQAGNHSLIWQAHDVPSGIHFYRIKAGNFEDSRKIRNIMRDC